MKVFAIFLVLFCSMAAFAEFPLGTWSGTSIGFDEPLGKRTEATAEWIWTRGEIEINYLRSKPTKKETKIKFQTTTNANGSLNLLLNKIPVGSASCRNQTCYISVPSYNFEFTWKGNSASVTGTRKTISSDGVTWQDTLTKK